MDVKYHGGNPHGYHSAPSGFGYIFQPGVAQKVKSEDEEFFRYMANAPGSIWEVVGMAKPEAVEEKVVEEEAIEEKKPARKGGRR